LHTISAQEARVHVEDISHFWVAYDSVQTTNDSLKQIDFIQRLYVDNGSIGLKEFMEERGGNPEKWLQMMKSDKENLNQIRPYTLSLLSQKPIIEAKLLKMKALYADFSGGDIFFTIGINNSGGTVKGKHVLIGCEVFANEKPDWAVMMVLHEFVHTMQKLNNNQILGHSIFEGMADFIAELAFGEELAVYLPNGYTAFGLKNEKEVWQEFKKYIHFNVPNQYLNWIYSVPGEGRKINGVLTKDLGYFMGHRICKSYYDKATDKRKAIKDLIELDLNTDEKAKDFLLASGYVPKADVKFVKNLKFSSTIPGEKDIKKTIYGYKTTKKDIIFQFTADKKIQNINAVSVAGSFNNWNPKAETYQMHKTADAHYELVVPKTQLEKGKTHFFKFVINGDDWVSPPNFAKNVVIDNGNINLTVKY
jgi:hypothetical protein